MIPEEMAKWNKALEDYDPRAAHTTGEILSMARYFVEGEMLIEADAEKEVAERLADLPTPADETEISDYLFERGQARYLHDETLIPKHHYACIVMFPQHCFKSEINWGSRNAQRINNFAASFKNDVAFSGFRNNFNFF